LRVFGKLREEQDQRWAWVAGVRRQSAQVALRQTKPELQLSLGNVLAQGLDCLAGQAPQLGQIQSGQSAV
jgi:hypothetical protein